MRNIRNQKKYKPTCWMLDALNILKPPEKLSVSEWADRHRVLDSKTSAEPGQWSTTRTPYLKGIMDAFTKPTVEEIIFCKCTQVGGTECLQNILGYIVMQDPSPTLIVYPTLTLAEFTSENRLQPMFEASPELHKRFQKEFSQRLELHCRGMHIILAGANSPASLSSRPTRYLLVDERDKFPTFSGKESDPYALAKERLKTFAYNKKIFQTSTPTLKSGPIWQAWEKADIKLQYYVPCPHCSQYQLFVFPQIKFDTSKSKDEIRSNTYYECIHCNGIIKDYHKPAMLKLGEWRDENGDTGFKKKTGFHLNTIYSPWVRFGDIAVEFLDSKDQPELLMNFTNSWLAEPWEQTLIKFDSDKVAEKTSGYDEGVVPDKVICLTGGVDVQLDHFYFTIRAWSDKMESYNIRHGKAYSWTEIEDIMNTIYLSLDGREYYVALCAIDSGYNTDEVYDFCALNPEWAIPVKGSNKTLPQKFTHTAIDREGKDYAFNLYSIDGAYYKDFINGRLNREKGEGGWFIYDGCDDDYCKQITSEHKVIEKTQGGKMVEIWKPKTQGIANHYLDCEVYCTFAADKLQVRYMRYEPMQQQISIKKEAPSSTSKNNNWIGGDDKWV